MYNYGNKLYLYGIIIHNVERCNGCNGLLILNDKLVYNSNYINIVCILYVVMALERHNDR